MIGRADIEGSKSNVAMNAWLPQASYPCGTFVPIALSHNSLGSGLGQSLSSQGSISGGPDSILSLKAALTNFETDCHLVVELHP